jgi:hypothetical protein
MSTVNSHVRRLEVYVFALAPTVAAFVGFVVALVAFGPAGRHVGTALGALTGFAADAVALRSRGSRRGRSGRARRAAISSSSDREVAARPRA